MEKLNIKIQTLEDAIEGEPLIKKGKGEVLQPIKTTVAILESGTKGGKAAVAVIFHMKNGDQIIGQFTENNFTHLTSVFKGAVARFKELSDARLK